MKKISLIIASTVLASALAACGNEKEEPKEENQNKVEQKSEDKVEEKSEDKVEEQNKEEKEDITKENPEEKSQGKKITYEKEVKNEFGKVIKFPNVYKLEYTIASANVEDLKEEKEFKGIRTLKEGEIKNLENVLLTAYTENPDGTGYPITNKEEMKKIAANKINVVFSNGDKKEFYIVNSTENNPSGIFENEADVSYTIEPYYHSDFSFALSTEEARDNYKK